MLEIRLHGRGGQGAQVGCQILADAFFRTGAWVQAFAAYGGERRGAPVTAYLRVDDAPITVRCDIERPHHLIVLDATLLADLDGGAVPADGLVVVNSPSAPCGWHALGERLVAVDASAIAERAGLGPVVATAMIGAFAGATGLLPLSTLTAAVQARSPVKPEENAAACALAYLAAACPAGAEASDAR